MDGFQPKLDQLSIISSRGHDVKLLQRALVIIHNDLIMFKANAAQEYCTKDLMQSLIYLTRSSNNLLVIILATSLLYSICVCGEVYVNAFFKLNGPIHLMSMLSARDNSDKEEVMDHTLMLHEQAVKLFVLLTSNKKRHHDLANIGLIEKIAEICEVFKEDGSHRNCCYANIPFDDDTCQVVKSLIEGRKLVGNIDVENSGEGQINMYTVDLYDTSTPVDVNVSEELIKSGYAWPDPWLLPSEEQGRSTNKDKDNWRDFYVTKVVDGRCFWAFIGNDAQHRISKLSNLLEEYVYSSDVCPLVDVKHGDRVCISLAKERNKYRWFRGCVLEVDKDVGKCHILLVDYGYGVSVDSDQVFPLPEEAKGIPHEANLCVLKGIQAAPSHTTILSYICQVVTNMAQEIYRFQFQMHTLGVSKFLLRMCLLPDKDVVLKASAALINILNNYKVRAEIGQSGGCKIVYQLLGKYSDDNKMLDGLLGMALNLIIECFPNRRLLVEMDAFLLFMKLYRCPTTNTSNKDILINILKNLVGNGWRLMDPSNLPDIRGIIQERVDDMKGCFNLPNLCGEEFMEEVKQNRRKPARARSRSCEVEPTPTYVSLSEKDTIPYRDVRLKDKSACASDSDSKSEGYKTGPDTDFEDNYEDIETENSAYMYGARINVVEDERHAFMYNEALRNVNKVDIANTVCAMLNSQEGGTVYVGVTKSGQIRGQNISRKERDNLRLGVDDVLGRFSPIVKHDKYEVKFRPVMKGGRMDSLKQFEERFVIELRVAKNYETFQNPAHKILYREGPANVEINIQQLRERAIKEEETKYQSVIKAYRYAIELTQTQHALKDVKVSDLDLD